MSARGKVTEVVQTGFPDVCLVTFQNRPFWFVRIHKTKSRSYAYRSTETVDKDKALRLVPEIYTQFLQSPEVTRKERVTTADLVDKWLEEVKRRCKANQITPRTMRNKMNTLNSCLLPYLMDRGLIRAVDFDPKIHLQKYPQYRLGKGIKISSVKTEKMGIRPYRHSILQPMIE